MASGLADMLDNARAMADAGAQFAVMTAPGYFNYSIGFKDSSGDLERFRALAGMLEGKRDFYLLQGKEHLLADALEGGASGFVVSLVQIEPGPFVAL